MQMSKPTISKSSLDFLQVLSKNNERAWFQHNKDQYLLAHQDILAFTDALLIEMRKHDHIETLSGKDALFRIYNDTRFSKDKSPYKIYWAGGIKRATKKLRGGYYFQIQPGASFAAGGFFSPEPADLLRIRQDIEMNYADWNRLLSGKKIQSLFGQLKGETVATTPRGFTKDHPAIGFLRHKQFYLQKDFTDQEVLSPDFLQALNGTFKGLRPYFDYMSDVLTTDLNGESMI